MKSNEEKLELLNERLTQFEEFAEDPRDPNHKFWIARCLEYRKKITILEYIMFGDKNEV